ncbi:CD1375 family protein [Jeotgalibacillus malaysiensis]
MTFTTDSAIANSYAILILAGRRTIDQVPDAGNLRTIVVEILTSE